VHQHEAVAVERELLADRAHVVDRHLVLVHRPVALRPIAGVERRLLAAHHVFHRCAHVTDGRLGLGHAILSGTTLARPPLRGTRRATGASRWGSLRAGHAAALRASPAPLAAGRSGPSRPTGSAWGGRSP